MTHLIAPRRGLGLRVQRGHVVHVERRLLIGPRLLELVLQHCVATVVIIIVEVRLRLVVSGELEQGRMDDDVLGAVLRPSHARCRFGDGIAVGLGRVDTIDVGGVVALAPIGLPLIATDVLILGLLQVHILHHRLVQPHPSVDELVGHLRFAAGTIAIGLPFSDLPRLSHPRFGYLRLPSLLYIGFSIKKKKRRRVEGRSVKESFRVPITENVAEMI